MPIKPPSRSGGPRRRIRAVRAPSWVDGAAVLVVAFLARFALVLTSHGGVGGVFGYDSGVYYAAADALVHGRVPYGQFVLLHPPGLLLVVAPFAALGSVIGDHAGSVVANTAFELLGAVNAVLVLLVARRLGLARGAALVGGLFYAVWFGAVNAEISVRLEPLGGGLILVGLLVLLGAHEPGRKRALLSGALLGAAIAVKIWWIVPVLLLVSVPVVRAGVARRRGLRGELALGAVGAVVLVNLPFFLLAPSQMWRMVVRDQLGRSATVGTRTRLAQLSSVHGAAPGLHGAAELAALAVVGAGLLVVLSLAWRFGPARPLVACAVVQLAVVLVSPSWFAFYSDYLSAAAALVLAAAVGSSAVRSRHAVLPVAVVFVAAIATLVPIIARPSPVITPFPRAAVARLVQGAHCVATDTPAVLIQTGTLSRDLARGCPEWIDVTGRTYDVDAPTEPGTLDNGTESRRRNLRWQADLRRYLRAGSVAVFARSTTGVAPETLRRVCRDARTYRFDRVTVCVRRRGAAA